MKKLMIATILSGAVLSPAAPAFGADIEDGRTAGPAHFGAFAGARLRMPLGGSEKPKAGLAFTNVRLDGSGARRFSKGIEVGFAGSEKLQVSIAGRQLDRLGMQPLGRGPEGRKAGVSTIGWVAIGAGVAIIVGAALFIDAVRDSSD
ncbi:MAG TPA: hypothetical protein VF662_10950 [Allosphingosinicella sp.]|jgi:hypothetical protein